MTPFNYDLRNLAHQADAADRSAEWPAASLDILRRSGALRWSIPERWGGSGLSPVEQLIGSGEMAAHCLTTAFVFSQREAAVRQLLKGPESLQERFLPPAADGDLWLTVGFSQLTTSRQHGAPALNAVPGDGGSYRLDGVIPWVTAADRADAVIAGATLADGRQILFALPGGSPGVLIEAPMDLAAMAGSRTAQIRCDGVTIPQCDLISGPQMQVMGPTGGGGLDTSCLALGVGRSALELLRPEAAGRPEVRESLSVLEPQSRELTGRLHAEAAAPEPERVLALRTAATLLALRSTQAALLHAKGAGFVAPHPAQRLARQALFFLVWSCPRPVADGVRAGLIGPADRNGR